MIIKERLFVPKGISFTQKRIRNFLSIMCTIYTDSPIFDYDTKIIIGNLRVSVNYHGVILLADDNNPGVSHRTVDAMSKPAIEFAKTVVAEK